MAKVFKVVGSNESGASSLSTTDWNKCVLCQESTSEKLVCPANSTVGAGYKSVTENLLAFDKIGCLPMTIQLSQLDEGQGLETAFRLHQAKWHDSCRLQYNKTKLKRAEKRKVPQEDDLSSDVQETRKYTRFSKQSECHSIETCFFCGKSEGKAVLHSASTFDLDIRVRQCALKLQDKPPKLSAGDLIAQEAKYHAQCLASLYNRARSVKPEECNI